MMDDDGPKTPRVTGSRPRWPAHALRCQVAANSLDELAAKKEKGSRLVDQKDAEALRALAKRCRALEVVFQGWEHVDPGLESRMNSIEEMYNLARKAGMWGVKL